MTDEWETSECLEGGEGNHFFASFVPFCGITSILMGGVFTEEIGRREELNKAGKPSSICSKARSRDFSPVALSVRRLKSPLLVGVPIGAAGTLILSYFSRDSSCLFCAFCASLWLSSGKVRVWEID